MTWEPEQQSLRQLLILLRDASDPNCLDHSLSNQRLISFQQHSDYNAYLIYILIKSTHVSMSIRLLAGSLLKSYITKSFNSLQIHTLEYIKCCCYEHLEDDLTQSEVNKMVSSIITLIIRYGQAHNWMPIMSLLIEKLSHKDKNTVKLALDTLVLICRDVAPELDLPMYETQLLTLLLPQLVRFYSDKDAHIRFQALHATSQFILSKQPSFVDQLDHILKSMYHVTINDKENCIRQEFSRIITMLLEAFPHHMEPYLDLTIDYMMVALRDPDDDIKMSACTFWVQYAHSQLYKPEHANHLPRLIEHLLVLMIYSKTELSDIQCPNTHVIQQYNAAEIPTDKKQLDQYAPIREGSGLEEEDSEMSDNLVDEEFFSDDTLRKRSAQTLEVLSVTLGEYITPVLLDHLVEHVLVHQDWLVRESGILALGAVAEGGFVVIKQHLIKIMPYLINSLQDQEPFVRSISCWTISRFSHWIVASDFFEPILFGLLQRILDTNSRVQESACAAFIVLCETSQSYLVPYLYPILLHTNQAFVIYGKRNRVMLYDALSTLADAVHSELNQDHYIYLLMPPLISKWNELSDNDTDLFPLLESLSNITAALGTGFIKYVDPVLSRCLKLILSTVDAQELEDQYQDSPPNIENLIAALNLLSGIVQGLGPEIEPFFQNTNLAPLLIRCIYNPVPEVLQSTFALIGDIARASFNLLSPFLEHLFCGIICTLRNEEYMMSVSVYNNALWSAGEMVVRWGQGAQPFVHELIVTFIPLLTSEHASVRENAMVALGRVCLACPQNAAHYVPQFIESWLRTSAREGEEKDSAFRGLCSVLKLNTQGAQKVSNLLLISISNFGEPSVTLLNQFREVLRQLKNEKDWGLCFSQLDNVSKKRISDLLYSQPANN